MFFLPDSLYAAESANMDLDDLWVIAVMVFGYDQHGENENET